jgi:aminopeptidase N
MTSSYLKISAKIGFALASFTLYACSSIAPLDPIIGNTGHPLSDVALKTDVKSYTLELEIFPESKSLTGVGSTKFLLLKTSNKVELKLDSRFSISKVLVDSQDASYQRDSGIITIDLGADKLAGELVNVDIHYAGKPHIALKAPWDGGFVWSETKDGTPWIATAVQGEGCDLFWPCKDHFADKADSMQIKITVPITVSAVTNGVLQSITEVSGGKHQFDWLLSVPASDYNIALNIGPYNRIQQTYTSVNGHLVPIEFWALQENTDKALTLIEQDLLQQILFFEKLLGPYPWGDQKLGFVETPHLGMEHQTINAYGKKYSRDANGYDWLLQHELAHEWFGNLITHEKLNDAWLHEGFGFYMQPAYSLELFGEAAYQYIMYKSYLGLMNCHALVREGEVTSKQAFNSDIYGKGGWTLHTLRWLLGDEVFWQATRELLYATNETHNLTYPITPRYRNTQDFIDIVNHITGEDYNWMFDVYLKQAALPELQETRTDTQLKLHWKTSNQQAFPMPVPISINGEIHIYTAIDNVITLDVVAQDKVVIDPKMQVLRYLPIIGLCAENQAKRDNRKK